MHNAAVVTLTSPMVSLLELITGSLSGVLWIVCYVLIVRTAFKQKIYAMPAVPMAVNVAWEFIFAFIYPQSGGGIDAWISNITMVLWFGVDLLIVYTYLKFWAADYYKGIPVSWHLLIPGAALVISFFVIMGMQLQFGNPRGGVYASFADNLLISASFIQMYMRRGSEAGQTLAIAFTKLFGTVFAAIYWILQEQTGLLWMSLYISIFVLDASYCAILVTRRGEVRVGTAVPVAA